MDLTTLINVTKNSISDVAGVVDLPLSLLDEVFQSYFGQEKTLASGNRPGEKCIFSISKNKQKHKKTKNTKKQRN